MKGITMTNKANIAARNEDITTRPRFNNVEELMGYLNRDLRDIKFALDTYLKPYKKELKSWKAQESSLVGQLKWHSLIMFRLLAIIYHNLPEHYEVAYKFSIGEKNTKNQKWHRKKFDVFMSNCFDKNGNDLRKDK